MKSHQDLAPVSTSVELHTPSVTAEKLETRIIFITSLALVKVINEIRKQSEITTELALTLIFLK